ncbi:SDR family oxidoreductase [Parachryseolinea silvisoli]|uniref:SDR family oxidoreductase n=1 Tax=Parachryseolinea silvisoli TaxID=2873601 RepID=UPI002265A518|nr:NAD(P)H-binding protein [Parachryseolinea silvisoli]MCD9016590.1 NAD(P)H-binding protein [Parachryseolinea silvisoli]
MNTTKETKTVLVIGGNGKTGARVVQRLEALGYAVRAASRSGKTRFDWNDQQTWQPAMEGVQAMYITFQPDLAVPGSVEAIHALTQMAKQNNVQQVVLLSGRGETEAQLCEKVVIDTGMRWTIVRASWFNQNFSEGHLVEPIQAGYVALPAGDVKEPFIDTDDIADVVVAALTDSRHDGQVYEVTGPRLLTFREAMQEIAVATGREIVFEQIPMESYASTSGQYGLPDDLIWLLRYLFTEVLDGRNEYISDGVERALGRKPTDFKEFVRKNAATGIWNPVPEA